MNTLRLACYYLRFHKAKTAILAGCIGLTIYLPLTSHWLVAEFDARMSARALLEEMANRIEVLEPAGPSSMIESSFVVGLKTLPVHYKIKPAA